MRQAQAGVTLVEMLVVLAVIAVMAGGTLAVLARDRQAAPLARAVATMTADLEQAAARNADRLSGFSVQWAGDGYVIQTGPDALRRDLPRGVVLRGSAELVAVSALGIPADLQAVTFALSSGAHTTTLQFDGVSVTKDRSHAR